ncbi:hypothetical protein OCC_09064 [Thermococcus litoralis DSM 5473]|jgi:hypothetical protein|uniref:Uncharacterized protein n=1 Tax=Thermococcus litoralis (strain ATCC 51850 / DSM 5473 / JCM 8560 / NS-C) TaxID=523849 RepID=H3ZKD3_THELN|nr:hypothetical protein [Thermococcus litoralis]EHR79535.1 hypothetical protein OCC_09064 [Thermococcus litoralis DSM 5473]
MKRLLGLTLLGMILLSFLFPSVAISAGTPTEGYGILQVIGNVSKVSIGGKGTLKAPFIIILPAGNYTILSGKKVKIRAEITVKPGKWKVLMLNPPSGKPVIGNATILGTEITYNENIEYPKVESRFSPGFPSVGWGCGGGWAPFYWTDKPYPLSGVDKGGYTGEFLLNGTITACWNRGRREGLFYTLVGPYYQEGIGLKNASFVTPISTLRASSDVDPLKGYLFNVSLISMVTPFVVALPVVPEDVYNVSAVTLQGEQLVIPHIQRVTTYNISVGFDHYLLTATIELAPWASYSLYYNTSTIKNTVRIVEIPFDFEIPVIP